MTPDDPAAARRALWNRAVRLQAQREHSQHELRSRLATHGPAEAIEDVLARLVELDLQSDARFARAWVRSRAARNGAARLRHDLGQRGIERELAEQALAELVEQTGSTGEEHSEETRARAVWQSRFGQAPADRREWARQARFLQGRGFATAVVVRVLKELSDESA